MEEKQIEGYENYIITKDGNIFNKKTKRKLKSRHHKLWYKEIEIRNKQGRKKFLVHRLVALSFLDNILNKPMVNHKDGDRTNNNVDNLEWVDAKENYQHSKKRGGGKILKISKLKIISIFKSKEWNSVEEFVNEIIKY